MALQGPLVVIGALPGAEFADALAAAGAFPIVEAGGAEAGEVIAAANPEAILLADPQTSADPAVAETLDRGLAASAPFVPVLARATADQEVPCTSALVMDVKASPDAVAKRLAAAGRVRSLHAAVLRRAQLARDGGATPLDLPASDPLEDSTVIVAGRGRTYPALSTLVGERAGLIGALRIETAASYLKARDIDGLMLGDGFGWRTVDALLTVIAEDARFRDLPIAILGGPDRGAQQDRNPLVQAHDPQRLAGRLFPYVRMHALEQRLKRILLSMDNEGRIDPLTGLLFPAAFMRELDVAIADSAARGTGLSLARFVFAPDMSQRANNDAARLVSRLIRGVDFGCRDEDASVLVAFTESDLRHAHIVARRIASVLKHTMLSPDDRRPASPDVTLATRKSSDSPASLLERVTPAPAAAE
jgi:hypothetical protein